MADRYLAARGWRRVGEVYVCVACNREAEQCTCRRTCPNCDGTGSVLIEQNTPPYAVATECDRCGGEGWLWDD